MSSSQNIYLEKTPNQPKHIGIIMDGNGRWAKLRGKRRIFGHEAGVLKARELVETAVRIELEALTYIRGRSIANAFIIIDEAQNLTMHEVKTIITRIGEGTKIVLTGDIEQIDNAYVNETSNGLAHAVEKFKEYEISGHVSLIKGERSKLATLASEIL